MAPGYGDSYRWLSAGVMAPGIGDASMARRTGDDLSEVLAELQVSGSIHFQKTIARRSQQLGMSRCERLTLPSWFVDEHGDKFEEWVILRTLSSAKPWRVHLGIGRTQEGDPEVQFRDGWKQFVAENRIEEGDSLVFAPNVHARSEFRVYISRGVTSGITNMPPQHGTKCNPGFSKRILRCNRKDGRMEIPSSFVKSHRKRLQAESVKVQGVHQESDVSSSKTLLEPNAAPQPAKALFPGRVEKVRKREWSAGRSRASVHPYC